MPQDFELTYTDAEPVPFWKKPVENFVNPQVYLVQGMRGGGKGVTVDKICENAYKEGFLVVHCWGARDYENYFYAINRDCKKRWKNANLLLEKLIEYQDKFIPIDGLVASLSGKINQKDCEELINQMISKHWVELKLGEDKIKIQNEGIKIFAKEPLHCLCSKSHKVNIVIPDYIDIQQESLDRANGVYWDTWENYNNAYINGEVDVFLPNSKALDFKNRKKTEDIKNKSIEPLIKFSKITCPNSAKATEKFDKQWESILIESRKEHRIVCLNPGIFESANDKFNTLERIIRTISKFIENNCIPLTEAEVGKPRHMWSKWQKSFHKIIFAINELRSVSPSSALSGEKDAGKTKKAIYDFIPEARHFKAWFIGDYQNPNDLYPSVRYQANIVIIKRASRELLGDDWSKLFDKIEKARESEFNKYGIEEKYAPLKIKRKINNKFPRIEQLPDNKGYAVNPATEFKLIDITTPSFHHKGEMDNFWAITGIIKIINKKKVSITSKSDTGEKKDSAALLKKRIQDEVFEKALILNEEGMELKTLFGKLQKDEREEKNPDLGLNSIEYKSFWKRFNTWKKNRPPASDSKKPPKEFVEKPMTAI